MSGVGSPKIVLMWVSKFESILFGRTACFHMERRPSGLMGLALIVRCLICFFGIVKMLVSWNWMLLIDSMIEFYND